LQSYQEYQTKGKKREIQEVTGGYPTWTRLVDRCGKRLTDDNSISTLAQPRVIGKLQAAKDKRRRGRVFHIGKGCKCTWESTKGGDEICGRGIVDDIVGQEPCRCRCFPRRQKSDLRCRLNQGSLLGVDPTASILELAQEVVYGKHSLVRLD
jgi:hypothetical protein